MLISFKELHNLVYGQWVAPDRWRDCETKNATLEMVNYVQEAFRDMLVENDWLDSSTKASALDKARKIQRAVGYPDFILDDKKLDDYYSGLYITESDSYTEMMEKWIHWRIYLEFKRLMKPVDRNEVNFNPMTVPEAGLYVNGKLAQGETIADHAGVKVAFKVNFRVQDVKKNKFSAYKNYLKTFGEERRISGLEEYSSEQMFFIGYATLYRDFLHPYYVTVASMVNQVLANQPEFAAVFNCPVDTPMNPTNRCAVW
ncbi:unnamed protein product [Angiostrongylus costaricensis]|uniref:Neprilysin n=1 Tax=Angiostrongylus costaricensis TaxID=334426 RepID=A0A158PDM5_ANGCS|nr:unnamed protein product [Angiostrongylus costaricensis]